MSFWKSGIKLYPADEVIRVTLRDFVVLRCSKLIPDKQWIKFKYYTHFHKKLDLKNPKTFNEKLQWLKLYYRRPDHTRIVDKYEMKQYVTEKIGPGYVIPVLGVWNSVEEIDFASLPKSFVLKTTHDCGGLVICTDKDKLDIEAAKRKLNHSLHTDYYIQYREWPYKNVSPRIIAEEYMQDESGTQLKDYKFFNFNGTPFCVQVDFDRFSDHKKNMYSTDWELLDFSFNYPAHPEITIDKPDNLDEMLRISRILSEGEPFVRTDFYSVNGKLYVGEITFFPASGYGKFDPEKIDLELGDKIILPEKVISR
ncbi:MAG: glycosyl transferase [Clostridiales bacterium]|nr:glycosyl transferase [Clostridiales bacterium]